jgi:hypothetical protein
MVLPLVWRSHHIPHSYLTLKHRNLDQRSANGQLMSNTLKDTDFKIDSENLREFLHVAHYAAAGAV